MIWTLVSAGVMLAISTPSMAEYYIVRESAAAPCRIVQNRPIGADTIVSGDRKYATRTEAEKKCLCGAAASDRLLRRDQNASNECCFHFVELEE
jgi:hypothetical protein